MTHDIKPYALLIDDHAETLELAWPAAPEANGVRPTPGAQTDSALRAIRHANVDIIICDIRLDPSAPNDRSGIKLQNSLPRRNQGFP